MAIIRRLIGSKTPERLTKAPATDAETSESESIVARWVKGRTPVWVFVDDVDKNFTNTALDRARVASFFDACRELAIAVPELRIRSAVRPNVWTVVKLEFEALSHVEQYLIELRWSEVQIRGLLARRIAGYLQRTSQDFALRDLGRDTAELEMISHVFQHPMLWGGDGRTRPPHVVLYTLSKHRPRWMIELCKVAAARAYSAGRSKIEKDDVVLEMGNFGNRRIADTIAEFTSQCPQTDELIAAFRASDEEFTTDGLFRLIENRILSHVHPKIAGVLGVATARDVAAFLFQIGLFYGRDEKDDGTYEHIAFSDRPSLFRARTAVDDSLVWEIHPVFRQALELRDSYGRETKKSRR